LYTSRRSVETPQTDALAGAPPKKRQTQKRQRPGRRTLKQATNNTNHTITTMGDRQAALVTFMGTFMTVHETVNDLSELADGVIIFEALSEMYVGMGRWLVVVGVLAFIIAACVDFQPAMNTTFFLFLIYFSHSHSLSPFFTAVRPTISTRP
jgi:hypothetical protein